MDPAAPTVSRCAIYNSCEAGLVHDVDMPTLPDRLNCPEPLSWRPYARLNHLSAWHTTGNGRTYLSSISFRYRCRNVRRCANDRLLFSARHISRLFYRWSSIARNFSLTPKVRHPNHRDKSRRCIGCRYTDAYSVTSPVDDGGMVAFVRSRSSAEPSHCGEQKCAVTVTNGSRVPRFLASIDVPHLRHTLRCWHASALCPCPGLRTSGSDRAPKKNS